MTSPARFVYPAFVAEYYDFLPVTSGRPDVEFYLDLARESGGPVLELGCGTGRVLLPIARAGVRIAGVDLSAPMLDRLRIKLAAEPSVVRECVRLLQSSITDFDLGEKYSLAIIPFRPFQHLLSVDDQLACLAAVHRHLEPGGHLALDFFQTDPRRMHDPAFLVESSSLPETALPDGRRVRLAERVSEFHRAEQHNDVELIYYVTHPDGRTERYVEAFPIRYFFRYEVEHLLARTGFRVHQLYGDFLRGPLRDDSPDMIFIAEKA